MSEAYYLRLTDHLRALLSDPAAFEEGRLPAERIVIRGRQSLVYTSLA